MVHAMLDSLRGGVASHAADRRRLCTHPHGHPNLTAAIGRNARPHLTNPSLRDAWRRSHRRRPVVTDKVSLSSETVRVTWATRLLRTHSGRYPSSKLVMP